MNKVFLKIWILVLISSSISAQDFQGKAVYQSKTSLALNFEGSSIPADRIKRIKEMMKNQLEKTFILTFSKNTSIYKEEEKLDQPTSARGMRFRMSMLGANDTEFKNITEKRIVKETEFSGKKFLIKDSLETYNWKMEQETKMIGENLCFKATTVIKQPKRNSNFRFGRRNSNEDKPEENKPLVMEDVIVTAWYTPNIPVSNGPNNYWGLPGLILEVNAGNTQILCTKIVMNPKEKIMLKEPNKGKVVTQKEYDNIVKEKLKEMRDRFRNERQKSGGERHFRIGG
ncbi:MAG: GLPGLI family protein [Lutibacter sp.]|uniref:GLPGLI family protein n=1 Tax=Lutibacter sp. TaxID=1925666 RepID=UPI00299ECCFB|nr:GLPGLI family protein [Lutibacter sp.]MDX1828732.1 GLPGLI family protein [Lutibacter sp.]